MLHIARLRGKSVRLLLAVWTLALFATCQITSGDQGGETSSGPLSPEEGLQSIRVPNGFEVNLVAAEPDIRDPVAIAWDEDGRMYVVEMPDYPLGPRSGRIKRLEDRDGDGQYEHSSLFADGLNFPDGVFPWRGGVLATAAPEILYLKDTDGDGQADERRVVFTGFGEGNPQHRVNGLVWGIDNWIYGANGDSDGEIKAPEHPDRPGVVIRRRDFRIRPDEGLIEPVSGNSQYGITFDDWGNRFVCNNSAHIRHVVLGTRYVDRNPLIGVASVIQEIAEHGSKAQIFPASKQPTRFNDPLDVGRFSAACGVHIYRGDLFPPEYHGNAFVCDAVGNLVHRDILTPDGVSFVARRGPAEQDREFFASTDTWCRPVYLATGPDGALYVVDMYRAVIEHPEWIPDSIEKKLDLRAGNDRGRIYRVRPKDLKLPPPATLGKHSTDELVEEFESANGWLCDTAQRLLFEKQDRAAVPQLTKLVRESPLPTARLRALWMLDGLQSLDDSMIERGLADPFPAVREHALRMAEGRLSKSEVLRRAAFRLKDDPEQRVRFQLVCTLGELDEDESVRVLAELANRDISDAWCRTATLLASAARPGLLLGQLAGPSSDFPALSTPERLTLLNQLAFQVGAGGDAKQVKELLGSFTGPKDISRQQIAILAGLADGLDRGSHTLGKLLGNDSSASSTIHQRLADVLRAAARSARDTSRPVDERADTVRLLGLGSFESIGDPLFEFLTPQQPEAVQVAAVRTLGNFGQPEAVARLLETWNRHGPAVRRAVLDVAFRNRAGAEALLDALATNHVSPAEIEPAQRARLLNHSDENIKDRAKTVFARDLNSDRRRVVAEFRDVLDMSGDRTRGEALFAKHCLQCHTVQRVGKAVGPELVGVRKRERAALLEDILNPNAALSPAYANYVVATKSGRVFSGIIVTETAGSITLRRGEAAEDTIPRGDIEEIRSTAQSLMPEGVEKTFTRQELADLIEYLKQIQ